MGWTLFANPASGFGGGRLAARLAPLLVLALWAAEAKAQSTVLVSTLGQPLNASVGVDTSDFAQRFTTGANVGGYTLASVELRLSAPPSTPGATVASAAPRVRVVGGAAAGSGSVEVASLTAETATIPVGDPATYTFTAPPNTALRPSTDYWLVIEAASSGGHSVTVAVTASDAEDATSAPGWSIDDGRLTRAQDSTGDFSARGQTFMIRVNGSTRDNTAAAGAPEIAGTATVGRRLRASRGSVADHDGVSPPFSYQWIRVDGATETEISGATASSYLLDAADLGKQVKVRLSFTDGGGAMETRTSDAYPAMGTVQAAPMPGTPGAALVSNLGQNLDGIGGVDTLDIAQKFTTGANAGGYTLSRVDLRLVTSTGIGTDTAAPRVRVVRRAPSGSDSVEVATLDAETPQLPVDAQSTYAFAAPESTALRPETDYWVVVEAASSGGGDVHLGATLSDAEDAGSAAGWSIDDRGFARSHGSTGAFFGNDAALMIRVNGGNRANTPATGTPEIAGTATEGERLQAGQGSVMDPDGVPSPFAYQWIRVDAGTETEIAGATASSYLLDAADVGTQVKVKLSFTDDFGTAETRTSEAFPPTGTVASAPQPDTPGAALVSNLGQLLDGTSPLASQDLAQKFTTGANVGGYTLASVELRLEAITADGADSAAPRVRVVGGAAAGSGSVEVASLTAETTTIPLGAAANYTFTATANVALRPSTPYWVVVEAASSGGGDVKVGSTDSDAEDAGSAAGWSIDDQFLTRADESTAAFSGFEGSLMIRVNGSARANTAATGTPAIAGTATEGERLQAGQGSVMDPDGVPPPFAYQWIRVDGGTDTEISGATSSSYLLDAADVGKRVKVRLSFTDDFGTVETGTSDPFPATGSVAAAPPPDTSVAALVSNVGQGIDLSASLGFDDVAQKFTTGANAGGYTLSSVDVSLSTNPGLGPDTAAPRVSVVGGAPTASGSVEVVRLTAGTPQLPAHATAAYPFTAPENIVLRPSTDYWVVVEAASSGGGHVSVSGTDSDAEDGTPAVGWSIDNRGLRRDHDSTGNFSVDTAGPHSWMIRVNGSARSNTPATGKPEILGAAAVGHRLEARQGSVADPDGVPSAFAYRWLRVDGGTETAIPGATGSGYRLTAEDEGRQVRVEMSFTDDEGAEETRLSDAFPPDGRVGPAPPPGSGGAALVSNLGQTGSGGREIAGFDLAQKFTTGANPAGYALTGVDIRLLTLPGPESDAPRVRVVRRAATGSGPDVVARLAAETSPIPAAAQAAYTFTASAGTLLRPSTDYWVVVEAAPGGGGDITVATALSDEEDAGAAAGWSIDDRGLERSRGSTGDFAAVEESLMIRIGGRAVVAAAPAAAP
ncbi:MAG: hypothetical protein OXI22_08395, partial [Defluviicoccus sp.]|nr:hypothetical protein [Defluviicoccus sp.]